MKPMEVRGKLRKYIVEYFRVGHTYAEVHVFTRDVEEVPCFFGFGKKLKEVDKKVWEHDPIGYLRTLSFDTVNKMHPDSLLKIYTEAVEAYENYKIAWDKFGGAEPKLNSDDPPSGGGGIKPSTAAFIGFFM